LADVVPIQSILVCTGSAIVGLGLFLRIYRPFYRQGVPPAASGEGGG
jgi:NADH:ubiquinone oxidoreductase subunit K